MTRLKTQTTYIVAVVAIVAMLSMPTAALASTGGNHGPATTWVEWIVAQVHRAIDVALDELLPDGGTQLPDPVPAPED